MPADSEGLRLARRIFDELREKTADPPGITRPSFAPEEQLAHDLARREAETLGLAATTDAIGNLYLTLPGRDPGLPAIMVGSHMDTVPHGGNFDGAAGVVAGVAVAAELVEEGRTPPRDLTVMAIRAEESAWFPASYIGSRAALGRLTEDELESARRADSGRSLARHIAEAGFDPEPIRRGEPQIHPQDLAAFVEVHIEQGPVLIDRDVPLGLVTGIRGSFRYRAARVLGRYDHSGATPRDLRRDAVLAAADLVAALEAEWDRLDAAGGDATITFGEIATDPAHHAFSKVAGEVRLCLDVRSLSATTLDELRRALGEACGRIAARRGVTFELGPETGSEPALMDAALLARFRHAAEAEALSAFTMASGAGHDAAVFANVGVPTAMVFIRNDRGSHNPAESMDMADFARAVRLVRRFVLEFE